MRRGLPRSIWIASSALVLFALMACETRSIGRAGAECVVFGPIPYDSREIPAELVAALKQHNLKWLELCDD